MPAPLLDREFLEKLERLTIHWQKSFPGLVGGHNSSRFGGGGQEFLDHRNFHPGDDLRAINWRAYLRLEKLFLKMFQIEPRVPVLLLVDVSESMAADAAKFELAKKIASALAYVGLVRLDRLTLRPFSNRLFEGKRCGGGRHCFGPIMDWIAALEPAGRTDFHAAAREFLSSTPARGLLIILSDFLDDGSCERALEYLADFGHELLLIQIWSVADRTPPWTGELDLTDAETGDRLHLAFDDAARERYTTAFDRYCETLERLALRHGGRYMGISTAQSVEQILFSEFARMRGVA